MPEKKSTPKKKKRNTKEDAREVPSEVPSKFLIIDSSYYNFFRFFAAKKWYGFSPDRVEASVGVPWLENKTFMDTFEKKWFETIARLCSRFKINRSQLIFARDGHDVWRYKLYPAYKANRDPPDGGEDDIHSPGPIFKHVNTDYHSRISPANIILVEEAEADDVIAVGVKFIRYRFPDAKIIIITGDHDLFQLAQDGIVDIYELKNNVHKFDISDPDAALRKKILGDPSDNIPSPFKGYRPGKGGIKKPKNDDLINDANVLKEFLKTFGDETPYKKQYKLNKQLVDFKHIPMEVCLDIESRFSEIFGLP